MLTPADFVPWLPLLILGGGSIVLLLVTAFYRSPAFPPAFTAIVLLAALGALGVASSDPSRVTPLLIMDGYARFFMGLICAGTLVVVLLGYEAFEGRRERSGEFYVLLLIATFGAMVLTASHHLASLFLGLEILSVALYALVAYWRDRRNGIEAGLKYLVLASTSSAFLLFGMALVYAATGSLEFGSLSSGDGQNLMRLCGMGLIVVGAGFKLAAVPFHFWAPDIYEGAPAPVAAYIATVSKGAALALALRLFLPQAQAPSLRLVFTVLAVLSMLIGNILALLQNNVKRLLAYSSIAHMGYLLMAFLVGGERAAQVVAIYLVAYFIAMLGAFGVVAALSTGEREADTFEDYRGLFWQRPWLAGAFTAILLSLTGVPPTAGFVGTFYLLLAGVGSALWGMVIVLVATSAIGLFYYLRLITVMYEKTAPPPVPAGRLSVGLGVALTGLVLALFWVGVYPAPLVSLVQAVSMR